MKITNLNIRRSPSSIEGDLYFEFGEGWYLGSVRLDHYMGDMADGLKELDSDGSYVFQAPGSSRQVRMQRDGEGVIVSFQGYTWPGDNSFRQPYDEVRSQVLEALRLYGAELEKEASGRTEAKHFLGKLKALGAA